MKHIHLLIAEDDDEDRMLIERAFTSNHFEGKIQFAHNGEEVIAYFQECNKSGSGSSSACPNLIMLDLNMPKLNGWETLEALKSNPDWANIPVVIFTTSKSGDDIKTGYRNGASSFIVKPDSYRGYVEIFRCFNLYWSNTVQLPK